MGVAKQQATAIAPSSASVQGAGIFRSRIFRHHPTPAQAAMITAPSGTEGCMFCQITRITNANDSFTQGRSVDVVTQSRAAKQRIPMLCGRISKWGSATNTPKTIANRAARVDVLRPADNAAIRNAPAHSTALNWCNNRHPPALWRAAYDS